MAIRLERRTGVAVAHLAGHLGIDSHRELKAACEACLSDPAIAELRLDLAGIESADATALGLLLVVRERANVLGRQVSLTGFAPGTSQRLGVDDVGKFFAVV